MTPEPCSTMWRAAARAVMKLVRRPLITARNRSSVVMSTSGIPCTSPRVMRLNDTSMLPACETTSWACPSTALSSERVEHRHFGESTRGFDVGGDHLERLAGATHEKDARVLASEFLGDRSADGPSPAVEDGVLVL